MEILSLPQPSDNWVLCNVPTEVIELFGAAHQVVEAFFLPKPPSSSQRAVHVAGSELLPRIALALDLRITLQAAQEVDMVGHHYVIPKKVPRAVKVVQTIGDDPSQRRLRRRDLGRDSL